MGTKSMIDVFAITLALMVGTAGLPHELFVLLLKEKRRKKISWICIGFNRNFIQLRLQ
jgi:cation/acetate symporter